MKILLDTNFILTTMKQKIDFPNLADQLFTEKIEWIVPQQVLNELGNLKDRKGMKLDFDNIYHYQKIIVALTETDRIVKEIEAIRK